MDDLRADFFDVLRGAKKDRNGHVEGPQRTLLLVHMDVDAICATKILVSLLKCDQVPYTLVPVSGRKGLIEAFRDNVAAALEAGSDLKYVVLVNCGATVDLVQDFGLDDDEDELSEALSKLVLFVADTHRPVEVCNVYNDGQIRLLMGQDEDEGIPKYEDIFRDSDDEGDDEEDEGEDVGSGDEGAAANNKENDSGAAINKRRRFDESAILKRRERRLWDEKRNQILFDYQQFSYFAKPTAIQVLISPLNSYVVQLFTF